MLKELTKLYDEYVDGYRNPDRSLPSMMHLKRVHTGFVVKNAELIADGEKFRDADSGDHAVFSHDIVKEKGWLDALVPDTRKRDAILNAVLYHNRRDIPEGLDKLTEACSHTVRDADKLDIFRVLEDQVEHTDWKGDSRAFWNLSVSAPPNPVVVECIEKRMPVAYQDITSLADFVLIQVGWMISGLHYQTSRRICRERGHLEFRRNFLHQLTDDPSIDKLCDLACSALS